MITTSGRGCDGARRLNALATWTWSSSLRGPTCLVYPQLDNNSILTPLGWCMVASRPNRWRFAVCMKSLVHQVTRWPVAAMCRAIIPVRQRRVSGPSLGRLSPVVASQIFRDVGEWIHIERVSNERRIGARRS